MSRAFIQKRLPFKPTDIGGCQLWLDGTDPAGINVIPTNGATISTWVDKSGNGRNATQVGGSLTYASTKGIIFDGGSSSYYSVPSGTFPTGNTFYSFFLIVSTSLPGGKYSHLFSSGSPAAGQAINIALYPNGLVETGWWTTNVQSATGIVSANTTIMLGSTYNSTGLFLYGNGTTIASSTTLGSRNSAASLGYVGAAPGAVNSDQNFIGTMFEAILFSAALTTPQRQQVESYLAQKWGLRQQLPQGHPGTRGIVYPSDPVNVLFKVPYQFIFVPTSIGGCQLWYDAMDATTITQSSGLVSQLRDKSGNNRHISQATTGNQPSYANNTLTFNGSQYLTNTISSGISGNIFTGYIIYKPNSTSGNQRALFIIDNSSWIMIDNNQVAENANGIGAYIGTTISTTTPTIVAVTSASTYSLNGNTFSNITNGYNQGNPTSINLGSGTSGGAPFNGSIYEVLVYNFVLSLSQHYQVTGYLAWKWGTQATLPITNTYYSASPNITNQFGISRPPNVLPIPPITISARPRPATYVTGGLLFFLDAGNSASYPGTGSTWTDLAGSGLTTTLFNSPTYSSANGGYLSFAPASSQYGQTSASLATQSVWSVEVWHYYTNTNNGPFSCILTEVWNSTPINFTLGCVSGSTSSLQAAYFNSIWYATTGSYSLPSVGWYHIVGTYDGTNIKLYVNNVLTQTQASVVTPARSNLGIRFMRRWDTGDYWGGRLAIIRIYNRALLASEVTTNYEASKGRFGLS
jgi:hypothetical protein